MYKLAITLCAALITTAVACAPTPTPVPSISPTTSSFRVPVNVVMGYVPNVQFAPWFVAEKKGYFASEGLDVRFTWGFEIDGIKLLGAGQSDFALLGGDQVIQARAQDIPIVYLASYYNGFPITIISLKEKGIKNQRPDREKGGIAGIVGSDLHRLAGAAVRGEYQRV